MTRGRTISQLLLTATSTLPMLFAVGCSTQRTESVVNNEPVPESVASVQQKSSTSRTMVGYWHNFDNKISTPTFRLANVDPSWDVVVVAFADDAGSGKVAFNLDTSTGLTISQFKTDIQTLQAAGKKVILSLGGQNGTMSLTDDTSQTNFQNTLKCILKKPNYTGSACTCSDATCYGFDGIDLDLESGAGVIHGSAVQTRLPNAVLNIAADWEADRSGQDFYLSMAPETPYVQGGTIAYSGIWGSYIPMIEALRSELDILHVQLYNNGGLNTPYAAGAYGVGTVDDLVSAQVMLIQGFTTASGHVFTGLNPSQVAIGVPTGAGASNDGASFTTANLVRAMDCLTKGTNCDTVKPGAKDVNGNVYWPSGTSWSNFRGVMTWSINWDIKLGGSWHSTMRSYLDQGSQGGDTTAPSTPGTPSVSSNATNAVALTWTASTDNVGVTGYKVARSLDNGSTWNDLPTTTTTNSFTDTSVAASTAYQYKVAARDAAGNWSAYSFAVSDTTPGGSDTQKPTVPTGLAVGTMSASSVPLTWTASTDNVGVAGYRIYRDGTLVSTVTGSPPATSYTDTTVGPSKTYVFQVLAYDAAGNASDLGTGLSVTTPAAGGGSCTASAYSNGHSPAYVVGDQVSNLGCISGVTGGTGSSCVTGTPAMRQYQCKVAGWCGLADYAPGYGWAWTYAWDYKSDCTASSGDTTAPSVPTNLASSTTTTSVTLTWTASTDNVGVTGYNIFRGGNKIGTASSASYTDSSLTPSTTYAYEVQAYDAAGNVSGHTSTLNVTTNAVAADTQAPSVPSGLTKGAVTSTSVAISWSASTDNVGVTGYDVYRNGSKIGSVSSTSYTDSGLAANTSYNYTVTAKDAAGNVSAQSSVLAAVTTAGATGCPGLTEWAGAQTSACYYPSLGYMSYKGMKYQAKDSNCMFSYCVPDGSGAYGACGWTLVGACQ
jgi:chitinase/chitodextrinase